MMKDPEDKATTKFEVACECEESKQNFLWLFQVLTAQLDNWEVERDSTEIFNLRSSLSHGMPFINVGGSFSYWMGSKKYTLPDSVADYALSLLACYVSASFGNRDSDYNMKVNSIKNFLLENLSPQDSKNLTEFMMIFIEKKCE